MVKFKKDKKGMIGEVKENLKNLNDQQKIMQFQLAWNGVAPKNARGFMGRAAKAASTKAPGIIYQRMNANMDLLIEQYKKHELLEETVRAIKKDVIGNAYDTSWKSRGKHLTPETKTEYNLIRKELEETIQAAENKKFNKIGLKVLQKVAKDLKNSEQNEKTKMMKDFGIIK